MKRRLAIGVALLALFVLPLSLRADTGSAAYYSASYSAGDWQAICELHRSWGDFAQDGACPDTPYWCVRPGALPGAELTLIANGVSLTCTVGDTVQSYDVASWEAQYVVEVSWDAFIALGLQQRNSVEVVTSEAPSVTPQPAAESKRCFTETGHCLQLGFLDYWEHNGGVRIFGYPVTEEFRALDTGLVTQVLERGVLEFDPSAPDAWQIRGRFVMSDPRVYTPAGAWDRVAP